MSAQKKERVRGSFVRMCAGCGKRADKSELIRIVKTGEGTVAVDTSGKISGRSAYICKDEKCLANLKKSKRLPSLLRYEGTIDPSVWTSLEELIDK